MTTTGIIRKNHVGESCWLIDVKGKTYLPNRPLPKRFQKEGLTVQLSLRLTHQASFQMVGEVVEVLSIASLDE